MLMTLTPACRQFDQHFTYTFFVRKCFLQLYLITVWLCNFLAQEYWRKAALNKLVKWNSGKKENLLKFQRIECENDQSYKKVLFKSYL